MNSIDKLNLLHPKIRQSAIDAYNEAVIHTPNGVHPVVDQTYRTFEESQSLYDQGRTKPGQIVSNAKPGQSYHNYALALDFHLQVNGRDVWDQDNPNWMTVVNIFKAHGFTWGGDFAGSFKDYPHLENNLGYNWRALLALHKAGDFIAGTEYVNI